MAGKVISRFQSGSGIHLISSTFYGTCNNLASDQVKQVEINDEHVTELKLIPGMLLSVKFTNGNTATNPKLKIYTKGTVPTELNNLEDNPLRDSISITPSILTWGAGEVILFVYDNSNNNEQWISNYLSVSGGNLTGSVILNNKNMYFDQSNLTVNTTPTANVNGNSRIYFRDTADNTMGYIVPYTSSANNQYLRINCTRGSNEHSLYLGINANGDKIVSLTATPWRTALGIGAIGLKDILSSTDIPDNTADTSGNAGTATKLATARSLYVNLGTAYSSSAPVTFDGSAAKALPVNGILPIANGGTGKATTTLVNYVFASPTASVTVGTAPSWRKLVAADIPNLNTSKLTAGTLGIARGGTGSGAVTSVLSNTTRTVLAWGPLVMVQLHGATGTPGASTIINTGTLASYTPAHNASTIVADTNGHLARLWVNAENGDIGLAAVNYTSNSSWYGTLIYIRVPT